MVRTIIDLDDELVEECLKLTGLKTPRAVVDYALRILARRERQKDLLKLKGKVKWEGDLAEMRRGRFTE